MRQDLLTKQRIDRRAGGTVTYKMERGVAGDLLFLCSGGSWNLKDIISVKLRHAGGVETVIDRVPALVLAYICDMKRGRPTLGSINTHLEGQELTSPVIDLAGVTGPINAFKVNIGHISLDAAKSELEITVDVAKAFGTYVDIKIANTIPNPGPDFISQYDKSNDLESTHMLVRELFLVGKGGASFFTTDGASGVLGKDINVMLYTNDDVTETDVEMLGAATNIDSEFGQTASSLVSAFRDTDNLPTPSLRVKVTGADSGIVSLLFIKERMVQTLTSQSTIAQVDKQLQKTEAIEKMDPNVAKAYRHAGTTLTSGELADIKTAAIAKTPTPA